MKIGAFADKYKIKKSTIRYYSDINLLLPITSGTYPDYDDKCEKDMDDIISYKKLGFSLEEIQKIKKLERFVFKESNSYINHMQKLIESKIASHKDTINDISLQIESLENRLVELKPDEKEQHFGIPFATLDYLKCPLCLEKFVVQNAHIENNQIQSGNLICSCGHHFKVEDGIITQTNSITKLMHKTESQDLDHSESLNNEHMALMKKAGENIKESIASWDHSQGIVFTNADTDVLLMSLEDIFKTNGYYIFCSFEIQALKHLKDKLEHRQIRGNFIFIHYLDYVPLDNKIKYLIDNAGCFFDFVFGYEKNSIEKFLHLFDDDAKSIIIDLNTKLISIPDYLRARFNKDAYLELYKKVGFDIKSKEEIGVLKGINKVFKRLEMIDDVYMTSYVLERKEK